MAIFERIEGDFDNLNFITKKYLYNMMTWKYTNSNKYIRRITIISSSLHYMAHSTHMIYILWNSVNYNPFRQRRIRFKKKHETNLCLGCNCGCLTITRQCDLVFRVFSMPPNNNLVTDLCRGNFFGFSCYKNPLHSSKPIIAQVWMLLQSRLCLIAENTDKTIAVINAG